MHTARQIPELSCHTHLSQCFTLMNGIESMREQLLHKQKYYEIQYIVSGQGYAVVNSQKLFLSTGDYIILLPEDQHSLKPKQDIRYYTLEFTIQDSFLDHDLYSTIKNVFIRSPGSPTTAYNNSSLKVILENLFREWQTRRSMYISYITLLFQQILIQCSRTYLYKELTDIPEGGNSEGELENFLSFLDAYMDQPDVIALYEQQYGIKRNVLTHLAKEKFGKTIFQLYTDKRFEYALSLLTDRKNSITDIAKRCAFSSVAAFSKAFTHYYGISPSKYLLEHTPHEQKLPTDTYADFSTCSYYVTGTGIPDNQHLHSKDPEEYINPKFQLL